jgi:hypothetical protein
MFQGTSRSTVTSGCRSAAPMPTANSTAESDRADGTRHPRERLAAADGMPRRNRPETARPRASALKPRANQHQVGGAGRQQRDAQCDVHSLAGCFEGRSHDGENIRRFYPASLADYFWGDSGLVYDSGTCPSHLGAATHAPSLAREPPVPRWTETPARGGALDCFPGVIRCPMRCSATRPS